MEAVEELLFLLMVQRVSMADVRERLLCFQGRKDDLILGLHQGSPFRRAMAFRYRLLQNVSGALLAREDLAVALTVLMQTRTDSMAQERAPAAGGQQAEHTSAHAGCGNVPGC